MRFLSAFAVAVLPLAAGAAAPPPNGASPSNSDKCPRSTSDYAVKQGVPLKPRKLTELPAGNMYVAVYRRDANGCEAPIVVKYDVGRR
jgi:hypothetical protein